MKTKKTEIPKYKLNRFRPVHRHTDSASNFGYNQLEKSKLIEGFELYSSEGLITSIGPLKSEFYRISLVVSGKLDIQIGLEQYTHHPRTICFTYPNQIIAKSNGTTELFGYYLLFNPDFLNDLVPSIQMAEEFPFYATSGAPLFQLAQSELDAIVSHVLNINNELQQFRTGRLRAIKMYVYLILLEAKRCFERQHLHSVKTGSQPLVTRFRKLVSQHYLSKRQVADYASMLAVSANHLNRVVKETTNQTASETIKQMLAQEAKSLLRYTDKSVSEIAYQLDFSDPASFNRFFRTITKETPLAFRNRHDNK